MNRDRLLGWLTQYTETQKVLGAETDRWLRLAFNICLCVHIHHYSRYLGGNFSGKQLVSPSKGPEWYEATWPTRGREDFNHRNVDAVAVCKYYRLYYTTVIR